MTRRPYLALVSTDGGASTADRRDEIGRRLEREGDWRRAGSTTRIGLWTLGEDEGRVRRLPREMGFLVGDVFATPGGGTISFAEASARPRADDLARRLSRARWGHYVALIDPGPAPHPPAIFRDPSGMLGAMTWSLGEGLHVVASDMVTAPPWLRPRRLSLNWDRIGAFLTAPSGATTAALFDDIHVVGPGDLLWIGDGRRRSEAIWTPADFVAPSAADLLETQRELVRRVDACTAQMMTAYGQAIVELSGGLDSSIVAGAIGATGLTPRVARWINYLDDRPEADERRFARDVTDRLGAKLTELQKPRTPLDEAGLRELASSFWPAIGGVDAGRDRPELAQLRETGARAIVSGQGGDGVFFQYPSAMVAADAFGRDGWSTLSSTLLADVARRTRQSVWAVLRQVWDARRGAERRPTMTSTLISRGLSAAADETAHAWVLEARARKLTPGKVLHIQAIATAHLYRGPSRRLQEADLLLPLVAQPVSELCLSIAVPDLAGGAYDRPFARQAFAERLPASVVQRRAKGDQSAYFARLVANSLDVLRPYLLDGVLAEAGLLDREILDRTLDPQQLISGGGGAPSDVLIAATVEAWVRHWQGRVPDSPAAGRR